MRIARGVALAAGLVTSAVSAWADTVAVRGPVPVSPGLGNGRPEIADKCPTFSWAGLPDVAVIELLVYTVPETAINLEGSEPEAVLQVRLPGAATSWTPLSAQCLRRRGDYGWSVRAQSDDGSWTPWAEPHLFRVASLPAAVEVDEAMAVLREYLEQKAAREGPGEDADLPERAPEPAETQRPADHADRRVLRRDRHPTLKPRNEATSVPSHTSLVLDGGIHAGGGIRSSGDLQVNNALFSVSQTVTRTVAINAGIDTTSLGLGALQSLALSTGGGNVAIGTGAGQNLLEGFDNTFVGHLSASEMQLGYGNNIVGSGALKSCPFCAGNTVIGNFAGANCQNCTDNVIIGAMAGSFFAQGKDNVMIGAGSGSLVITGTNNVMIGAARNITSTLTISNTVLIGDASHNIVKIPSITKSILRSGIPILIDPFTGQLGMGTAGSSRRFKDDIRDMGSLSTGVLGLRPVAFRFKPGVIDGPRPVEFGLIAEEVAQVFPDLVRYDQQGRPYSVRYELLTPMLLNELQRQHRLIEAQQRTLADQRRELERLSVRLKRIERRR